MSSRTRTPLGRVAFSLACATLAWATPAATQSLISGEIAGSLRDPTGSPVGQVDVTLTAVATGVARGVIASRAGRYRVTLLEAGEYQLLVERLGYRPVRVLGVLVRPGAATDVSLTLTPAPPPVTHVDTVRFSAGGGGSLNEWLPSVAVRRLPDETGEIADLAQLASRAGSDLATEGLPGSLSGFMLDGVRYRPARDPGLPAGQTDDGLAPLSSLEQAELVTRGADAEWTGVSGATLVGLSRTGTARLAPHLYVDGTGGQLSSSKYFDPGATPNSSFRGGVLLSGPIERDTAQFVLGIEGRRLETPLPVYWGGTPGAVSIATVAQDLFATSLSRYLAPRVVTSDAAAAFGGVNWHVSPTSRLAIQARYARVNTTDPDLGAGPAPSLGATLDTRAFIAGATLSSELTTGLSQELRLGATVSTRAYGAAPLPVTTFVDVGSSIGSDPSLPGRFRRTTLEAGDAVHYALGAHELKFGVDLALNLYNQTYGYDQSGAYAFSGAGDFALRRGVFTQSLFVSPAARFSVPSYGAYAQDQWTALPGFTVLASVRYDRELLSHDKVVADTAWRRASGLDNTRFPSAVTKPSPRLGFTWELGREHSTAVYGTAGVYFDEVDPGLLGEAITESQGDTVRHGVGVLAAWPGLPDRAHAPATGTALTLLAPGFQVPRSGRASLGIWQALGSGLGLTLSGTYRHTDYLPRRVNLNRLSAPAAHDQYGRPLYGTLVQQGDLLTVQPGTNDRFAGFDLVSAIDADGYSDYWGATITLERHLEGLHVLASYTYSHTTDNWLSGPGDPAGQLSPFPDSLNGHDWAVGRSDLDIPHRVVLAAEVRAPVPLHPRFAVVYRYRSGAPFTPGFRPGVDANGDGGSTNDPAFIDAAVPGTQALLAQWDCLRGQVGRFVDRNACRDPAVESLDLRATVEVVRLGHLPFEIVADLLNVLESDVGVRDHALYLVDPTKALVTKATTGTVTVPLVANPAFGTVLVRQTPGRTLRLGVRMNY